MKDSQRNNGTVAFATFIKNVYFMKISELEPNRQKINFMLSSLNLLEPELAIFMH